MTLEAPRGHVWAMDLWAYACLYSLALIAIDVWTGFHIGLNDFWGAYYQADTLEASNAETLYNGFFPIGYPLLLRLAPGGDFIEAGFEIAAVGRILLLGAFGTLALRFVPGAWAMAATVMLSLVPRVFENVLTPASDLPMMALALAGGGLLVCSTAADREQPPRIAAYAAAGFLLGLGGLIRQHGLVLAAGLLLGAFVVRPRDLPRIAVAGLACGAAYAPQVLVNLLAHRGPFETFQYINIYKMVHGVELRDIPSDLSPNVRAIVAKDPWRFAVEWSRYFFGMLPVLLPAFLCGLAPRDAALRRAGRIVVVAGMPYLAAVSLGWSTRAVLPLLPWTALFAACLAHRTLSYAGRRIGLRAPVAALAAFVIAVGAARALTRDAGLVRYYLAKHRQYAEVERALVLDGVVHPKQVYTSDDTLYLPMTAPHWPYFDGTWGRFALYKYAERYPELKGKTVAGLREDCHRQGITHLVLGPGAGRISPALRELYSSPKSHAEFKFVGTLGEYTLFRRHDA